MHLPTADLVYEFTGPADASPVVVGVHGLSSSRANDDDAGLGIGPLGRDGFRVLRYDARGHGGSTGRDEPGDYVWPALADDLIALLDGLELTEPVDAVGASMGTATILWAALTHPERFRRLVLTIPPTAWETRAAQAAGYLQAADLVEARGIGALAAAPVAAPPPVLEGRPQLAPAFADGLAPAVLRGAARSDLPPAEQLAAITQPVLLLPWAGDPGHPVSTAERLAQVLPDARLELATTPADLDARPARIAEFLRR